jgi:hypothetical protein
MLRQPGRNIYAEVEPLVHKIELEHVKLQNEAYLAVGKVDLRTYRSIRAPYNDWAYVADRCREIGEALFLREMEKELPTDVREFIDRQNRRGTSRGTPGGSR